MKSIRRILAAALLCAVLLSGCGASKSDGSFSVPDKSGKSQKYQVMEIKVASDVTVYVEGRGSAVSRQDFSPSGLKWIDIIGMNVVLDGRTIEPKSVEHFIRGADSPGLIAFHFDIDRSPDTLCPYFVGNEGKVTELRVSDLSLDPKNKISDSIIVFDS